MISLIALAAAFLVGMMGGAMAFSERAISNNRILEASMVCAVNSDLNKVVIGPVEATAYCVNGATFKLKEK